MLATPAKFALMIALALMPAICPPVAAQDREYYELRIYQIFDYEKQASLPEEDLQSALDRFLGTWNSVHTQLPDGDPVKVQLTYNRVLDGKFVQEKGAVDGKDTALAMFTYDADNQCFRMWHFSAEHQTSEGTGKWDPKTTTLTWTVVDPANEEMTMTTRHRFVDDNRFEWDVTGKDANGSQIFQLQGKANRIGDSDE